MATAEQIKKIHTLKGALGLDDGTYRDMLADKYGASSSKGLNVLQAADLIDDLTEKAVSAGVWTVRRGRAKYDDLKGRDKLAATPAQLRMIEAMWRDVSRMTTDEDRAKALRSFVHRIVGVNDLRFLLKADVQRLVKSLENMGARYERV